MCVLLSATADSLNENGNRTFFRYESIVTVPCQKGFVKVGKKCIELW